MSEEDFLESDPQIRGQNYCCLSFVSPEEILNNKNVFFVHKFLKTAKNYDLDEQSVEDKYKDFMYINQEKLESEFYEKNEFKTTVRGIKVRGSYDTLQEAQVAQKNFNKPIKILMFTLGKLDFGCPGTLTLTISILKSMPNQNLILWSKNIEKTKRKKTNISRKILIMQENKLKSKKNSAQKDEEEAVVNGDDSKETPVNTESIEESLNDQDPWLKRKSENRLNIN